MNIQSRLTSILAGAAVACAAFAVPAAHAQSSSTASFPNRPIRFVVPYPPGGGNDVFARLVGQKLSENVGQAVVIDNRPGAAGLIAGDAVAKSAPDGYTIMVDQSSIATNPLIYRKMPFDVRKDLAPIMWGATLDNVVLVSADSSIRSVADLIAQAKAQPGRISYGSVGHGSSQHLAMEMFSAQAGIQMLHVPYKGTAPAITAVSVNEVQLFLISAATAQTYIRGGRVRAIATTGTKRSSVMPDVPTMIEAGLPNYVNYNWLGIFAAASTPKPIVDRLNAELVKALSDATVTETLNKQGWALVGGSPEALRKLIVDEMARYDKVVRDGNIHIDQP